MAYTSAEEIDCMEQKKCAHPACRCIAPEDSKYCSTYCEDAKDMTELTCECGHASCADTLESLV